jgi:MFS family permease
MPSHPTKKSLLSADRAFRFVLILGFVNLFADLTYEGASSINGTFLRSLGASAAAVGIVAGVGEFLGYALRFIAGQIADKTGKYWTITFVGYIVNLFAVPALALAGHWPLAACLMITERVGRAIRKPSVEAMLSYTTNTLGKGRVYALNNALDQAGAVIGPLLMALVLMLHGNYQTGYLLLLISAILALVTLALARRFFPNPSQLETGTPTALKGFGPSYWLYMAGGACVAAGLVSFELISFHFAKSGVMNSQAIPLLFAGAMAMDGLAGLVFGRLFDRIGMPVVLLAFGLSSLFAPLVFLGSFGMALAGMALWGVGFGAQDTLLKALIAGLLPQGKRNLAFGLFYGGYGAGWLVGSVTTGLLYARSLPMMVGFSVVAQLASLPLFIIGSKMKQRPRT